jgi:hypothetical protein
LENLKEITHTGTPEIGVWSPFDGLTKKKKNASWRKNSFSRRV